MWRSRRLTLWIAVGLIAFGGSRLLFVVRPASTDGQPVDYIGWATLCLGLLTLGLDTFFRWREDQRAARAEARELARNRHGEDD